MEFIQKLRKKWDEGKFVCIGLDPVIEKLPESVHKNSYEFNMAIIDSTHDIVAAYKPNSAFYEAQGADGISQLKQTIDYIVQNYPDVPVILDFKRADIGSTNEGYVKFAFDYLKADAVTLHPYLGKEALRPFLERADKGLIILCKTSNPGSDEFQNLDTDGKLLYEKIAENICQNWNENGNMGLVVGATYPEELKKVRALVGDMPILIPGIGVQGGDLEATLKNGLDGKKQGVIISSSRGIIFASKGDDFAKAARAETEKLDQQVRETIKKV